MPLSISKALNIEKNERSVVYLLLLQSVFLGIFAGALDVGANALFLDAYSADLMPRAFMISGAVGILFTSAYTFFQKRMQFRLFTIVNLLFVIILTGALRLGYSYTEDPRLTFALLVFMGPVVIISMLGFWGTAGRYFTLRDGKRLFGIIDTGSVVGMILAFYAVPVLVQFNFMVHDTLLIGLVSLLAAMVFQVIVLRKHQLITQAGSTRKRIKKSGFLDIFRKRYTSMMALFVVLSVITAFFIHYSFMWATEANYSDSRELTGFLGAFFGTMMIFTVIIKSTLYGWLMKNYGLRVTLLISPALLLILTIIASVVGGLFGYSAESASFTFFFLVIALSKLFNRSLKDAIESPSMKILYQSLDSDERFDVQARIDGVVNELTAFMAGLVMAGLLLLSFINVIHFSYILIFLLVIWVILGYSLYRSYRKTLNETLASAKTSTSSSPVIDISAQEKVSTTPMYGETIRLDPYFYHASTPEKLDKYLGASDPLRQYFTWQLISGTLYSCDPDYVDEVLKATKEPVLQKVIREYTERLRLPGKNIEKAFRSADKNEIIAALLQTIRDHDVSQVPHIITLLRDRDLQLRATAIEAAGKLKVKELGSYLVDYLGHPDLYSVTWSALVNMGEIILENLENAFHKTGTETFVRLRIVRAMVAIGGDKANEYLFQKISYHQRDIREAAIRGLYLNKFTPDARRIPVLQAAIYEAVLAGAGNIATEAVLRENDPGIGILDTIREEKRNTDNLLFNLLGITYEKSAIEHVQRSIEDSENEDTGFALELLNLIVDEQVYAYLEPYFDILSAGEKIRRLQSEMPVEILPYYTLLIDLLNRDSLYTGNYLRVCAIDAIRLSKGVDAGKYLAAQVFHPDPVIRKTASLVLADKDAALYENVSERLDMYSREIDHDISITGLFHGPEIIKVVEDLKQWNFFRTLDREVIFRLASHLVSSDAVSLNNPDRVSMIKAGEDRESIFSDGIVINLTDYPSVLEHMALLTSESGFRLYQADRTVFRELLFDMPGLLYACNSIFGSTNTAELLNPKVY
ncbi:MAG: Npt1/Npt2 family nucleotide transporter [Bacteroidales bacterium]